MHIASTDLLPFKCKGEALRCVVLYSLKYREEFESEIEKFSREIWNNCGNINNSNDSKYDKVTQFILIDFKMISNALKYFKTLIMWPSLHEFFATSLTTLISSLIFPNLVLSCILIINFN